MTCNHLWIYNLFTMFNGIDSSVSNFDDLVQYNERRLKRRQVNEHINGLCEVLLNTVNLLTTSRQTSVFIS